MANLFTELKRRNVLRVAASYVVISWLAIEVSSTLEETLALPAWFDTVVFAFLALGFPIALIFSWAFELTPEGLKKTEDVDTDSSVLHHTAKRLDVVTLGALVIGIALLFARPYIAPGPLPLVEAATKAPQTEAGAASIAVLPFVDLSPDNDQEYFSDGISEEILNVLAKIPDLHVTSRSSAFAFKDKDVNIPDVAKQLGVAHVLEGSVRKAGTTLRITAQLIEAETDKHLWSETYDRELKNIFEIQDEISAAIVDALKASLGIEAQTTAQNVAQTANPEAYTEYLLGQHAIHKRTNADITVALAYFEKAVALDPNYAPAHVGLALAHYLLSNSGGAYGTRILEDALSDAEPALDKAFALDPFSGEAHAVAGLILKARGDYEQASVKLEKAIELNPSNTDAYVWYAQTLGDMGRDADQFAVYKQAYEIDPLAPLVLSNYLNELNQRRMFKEQEPVLERLETVQPEHAAHRRSLKLASERRLADAIINALEGIEQYPNASQLKIWASFALARLDFVDAGRSLWPFPDNMTNFSNALANPEERLETAREAFEADPNNPATIGALMFAHWATGDLTQAERIAKRFIRTLPDERKDTDFANWILATSAWKRGETDVVNRILPPLEAQMQNTLETGIKGGVNQGLAVAQLLRGNREAALENLQLFIDSGDSNLLGLDGFYRGLGIAEDPGFMALRADMKGYVDSSRKQVLRAACGKPGFEIWTPKPETCATLSN